MKKPLVAFSAWEDKGMSILNPGAMEVWDGPGIRITIPCAVKVAVFGPGSILRVVEDRIPFTVFIRGDVLRVIEPSPHAPKLPLSEPVVWLVERISLGPDTIRWCTSCDKHVLLTTEEMCRECGHEINKDLTLARAKATLHRNLSIIPFTEWVE